MAGYNQAFLFMAIAALCAIPLLLFVGRAPGTSSKGAGGAVMAE